MPVVDAANAAIMEQIADLLDIQGANPFCIRACRSAARTIGVGKARRGWLEKKDVLNTRPLAEVLRLIKQPR